MHQSAQSFSGRMSRFSFLLGSILGLALAPLSPAQVNLSVTTYGAQADGILRTDGAISSGSSILTSASGAFTSVDKGKYIQVIGAGPGGSSRADANMAQGSAILTSPSGGFNSADIGRGIIVIGAGASGANLITTIAGYTSNSSVVLTAPALTSTGSASYYYGAMTLEGTIQSVLSPSTVLLSAPAGATITGATYAYGTDNHAAFQTALDTAGQSGGGTVTVPLPASCPSGAVCGYVVATTDQMTAHAPGAIKIRYNNVSLIGAAPQANLFCRGAWATYYNSAKFPNQTATIRGNCLAVGDDGAPRGVAGEFISNVTVANLHLYGMTNGNTRSVSYSPTDPPLTTTGDGWDETHKAIYLWENSALSNIVIDSVYIQDFKGENIYSGGSVMTGIIIRNSTMTNFNGDGISMLAADLQVLNNTITNGSNAGIENSSKSSTSAALVRQLYQGNTIADMPREGLVVVGVDSGIPTGSIQILNNYFDRIAQTNRSGAQSAIYLAAQSGGNNVAPSNVTISGNTCHDCFAFGYLATSGTTLISNNTIIVDQTNGDTFLYFTFPMTNLTISNNTGYRTAAAAAAGRTLNSVYTLNPGYATGNFAWNNVLLQNNSWNLPGTPHYIFVTTSGPGWSLVNAKNLIWQNDACSGCTYADINHGVVNLAATTTVLPYGPIVYVSGNSSAVTATLDAAKELDGSEVQVINSGTAPVIFNSDHNLTLPSTVTLNPGGGSAIFHFNGGTGTFSVKSAISVVLTPSAASLGVGQTAQFSASVTGAPNQQVTWSIAPVGAGAISSSGLYTAPASIASVQTVTVKAASIADPTKVGTATVTLAAVAVAVSMNPPSAALGGGQSQQFAASVTGTLNQQVSWSILPAGLGTISAAGLYSAPALVTSQQTVTAQATSAADSTKSASRTVTLNPVSMSLTPPSATLQAAQTAQFAATVNWTNNPQVSWSISPAGVGSISANGLYTAPATLSAQPAVTVTATCMTDATKAAMASITLTPTPNPAIGYAYQSTVAIAHGQVSGTDQSNFPVLIKGVYPLLATAAYGGHVQNANGYDIAFSSDAAGLHLLNWEVESYDPTTGSVSIWVQVPALSHTIDTVLYMSYGNPAVASFQGNRKATWDSSFAAVYHMSENAPAVAVSESSSNANSATGQVGTSVNSTVGVAGTGLRFNGSSDYLNSGNSSSLLIPGPITLEGWVNLASWPRNGYAGYLVAKGQQYFLEFTSDNSGSHGIVAGTYYGSNSFSGTALAVTSPFTGAFHHLAATWDGLTWNLYLDGALKAHAASSQGPALSSEPLAIGAQTFSGGVPYQFLNGTLDEVHVASAARSAGWIATEYNNQSQPSAFYLVGSEQLGSVTPPPAIIAVVVTPATGSLTAAQTVQLSANVSGSANQQVTWSVAGGGSVSVSGLYTAPSSVPSQQTNTVTATSIADPTKSASAVITVNPAVAISVSVNPPAGSITAGQTLQLSASVTGAANQQVTWSVSGGGSVSSSGLYTAPASVPSQQTATVTAISAADPTKSAGARITVNPAASISVSVNPPTGSITAGQTLQLSASISGTANQQVTWSVSGGGSISSSGLYTAPASVPSQQTTNVTATSAADASKTATASIVISPVPVGTASCGAPSQNSWTGCYYQDLSLGTLGFTRVDPSIQFNWPANTSIGAGVGPQNYSAQWQGNFVFQYSWYYFYVTADDTVRLYVDGALTFDSSTVPGAGPYKIPYLPSAGTHLVRVDYVHHSGAANIQIAWGTAQ